MKNLKNIRIQLCQSRGVSLVEIMIALLVFSVGLLLLVPLGVYSINANQWSDRTTQATFFAQEKLEELKNADVLSSGQDSVSTMQRVWTVQALTPSLSQISVQINWKDFDNRSRQYLITTFTSQ